MKKIEKGIIGHPICGGEGASFSNTCLLHQIWINSGKIGEYIHVVENEIFTCAFVISLFINGVFTVSPSGLIYVVEFIETISPLAIITFSLIRWL